MYQAFYRKWRPKTFNDVVGQDHITETLKRQIISGRLSHAYLFVGTRGTGKTTCAKILSKSINCMHPESGNPCNKCNSCIGIENGSIMDVLELDAASNNGVDNVRALREEAVFTPVDVKKRVYIIDEVHMLSTAAFNALLKILEEPPEHLIFILATTEIHKVPATILSRCQRYTFKRILPAKITERLQYIAEQEGITLTSDAAELLARLSDGSLRDALSLLDQCASDDTVDYTRVLSAIGLAGGSEIALLLSAVAESDAARALSLVDSLYSDGKVMASVLEELANLVRDVLVTSLMPKGGAGLLSGGFDCNELESFTKRFTAEQLLSNLETLRETMQDLSRSSGGKLEVELCLIRLCDQRLQASNASLLSRLLLLEEKVKNGPPTNASVKPPSAPVVVPAITAQAIATEKPVPEVKNTREVIKEAPSSKTIEPSGDIWKDILNIIQPIIDIPPYTFLSDQAHSGAVIDNNTLTIKAKNPFVAQIINVSAVTTALKEAAMTIMKNPITVRIIQEADSISDSGGKLDALSRFSNITFE